MTKFLLNRPIAVFMVTLALLVFSALAFLQLPINLLPPIDVPSIVIKVSKPNSSPQSIEENILKPIRENLLTLSDLKDIESFAASEAGQIQIYFSYKANMNLMYIEVNERIDRLQDQLPQDLTRPKVMRLSTADIPVIRLQVIPKDEKNYVAVSELTTKVLRRRIEQIEGVSMVDIVGDQKSDIAVTPQFDKLDSYDIPLSVLISTINNSNVNWGSINVKEGQYRYYLKVASAIASTEEILRLPIHTADNKLVRVGDVAQVEERVHPPIGYHLLDQDKGLAIIIHKQSNARMIDLIGKIEESVKVFAEEYPQIKFNLTQDQSALLNVGINNLKTALLFGGVFAFAVLFIFMGNIRLAIIMGVSLPVSLLMSFLVFFIAGISINIISLSGLALGLGMLIDNAIIVLDNISAKRKDGFSLTDSCVLGVKEVSSPLISSVLTTLAVFVPLVFLHGMSGSLFFDQAIAVSAILGVSLLVSFSLLPLLYKLSFNKKSVPDINNGLFKLILNAYEQLFNKVWQYKALTLSLIIMLCFAGIWLGLQAPRSVLPNIQRNEFLLKIDWNEPISLEVNEQRVISLVNHFDSKVVFSEAEVGEVGSTLGRNNYSREKAGIYVQLIDNTAAAEFNRDIRRWVKDKFPNSIISINPAPNAFDQLFASPKPFLMAKLRTPDTAISANLAENIVGFENSNASLDKGFSLENSARLIVDNEKLALYNVDRETLQLQLSRIFGETEITNLKRYGDNTLVSLTAYPEAYDKLDQLYIKTQEGSEYPLNTFISIAYEQDYKHITADRKGIYQSISFASMQNTDRYISALKNKISENGLLVDFDGTYFETSKNLKQLSVVLLISFTLLYFILAAQFESFLQPLIIIFTLPLGIGGSLLLIFITGSSLNIMSAIGIIVMLGIMINDAILKLDAINRHVMKIGNNSLSSDSLFHALHQAGVIRLRPILMTSATTILALIPILFTSGLGADLQHGLVIAVIGGLTVGTITSLFFVPLMYYYLSSFSGPRRLI